MRVSAIAVGILWAALSVGTLSVGTASAQTTPSAADIQWAQQTLKNQGYDIGGRVSNRMTTGAHAAIAEFQRRNSLPASGELTQATIDALMGSRKPAPTMGVLGQTKSSGALGPAGSAPPQPRAVPTQRVGGSGDGDKPLSSVTLGGGMGGGSLNTGVGPAIRSAPVPPVETGIDTAPQAAPRALVEGDVAAGAAASGGTGFLADGGIPNWARYALWGAMAALGLVMLVGWGLSGRKRLSLEEESAGHPAGRGRHEPVFERGGDTLTAGLPPLTAPTRSRR